MSYKKNKITAEIWPIAACIIVPAIFGCLSGDLLIGGTLFSSGLLAAYLAGKQKRIKSLFSVINAALIAYVAFINHLYGTFFVCTFIFIPLEIYGFINWSQNLDRKKDVKIKQLTPRSALILIATCLAGSFIIGYILTKIPGQQVAFLDAAMNCMDICAIIIMARRYKESWILWIISGSISVVIWAMMLINGGENALMRFISALGFLFINFVGFYKWNYRLKKDKRNKKKR